MRRDCHVCSAFVPDALVAYLCENGALAPKRQAGNSGFVPADDWVGADSWHIGW